MDRIFLVLCYRTGDIVNVEKQLASRGVRWWTIQRVPFWNMNGDIIGNEFAILYRHSEELSIEIQTYTPCLTLVHHTNFTTYPK